MQKCDKIKEKNHLVKVKKLSTLDNSEKETLRKNLNKNSTEVNRGDNISRAKEHINLYLESEKSDKLLPSHLENQRFYKTEQNMLNDFQSRLKDTDTNFGKINPNIIGKGGKTRKEIISRKDKNKTGDKPLYSNKMNYSGVGKYEDKDKVRRNDRNQFRENINYNQLDISSK